MNINGDWIIGIGFALGTLGVLIRGWMRKTPTPRNENLCVECGNPLQGNGVWVSGRNGDDGVYFSPGARHHACIQQAVRRLRGISNTN